MILALLLLARLSSGAEVVAKCPSPGDRQIDDLIQTKMSETEKPCGDRPCPRARGLLIGIVTAAGSRVRGQAPAGDAILDPAQLFEIASLSKTFTSTMIIMMVHEGKVDLDVPVARYLPKESSPFTAPPFASITVRQLLTHRSGLPEEPRGLDEWSARGHEIRQKYALEDLYRDTALTKLEHAPGAKRNYSSFGYAILTAVIEHLDNKSFAQALRDRITHPLGMADTTVGKSAKLMAAYTGRGELSRALIRYTGADTLFDGSGGIKSTMNDMLKFARAQAGLTSAVPAGLRRAMDESQKIEGGDWETKDVPGQLSHTGSVPGYKSYIVIDKASAVAAVAFSNRERPDAGVVFRVTDAVLGFYRFCQVSAR